MRRGAIICLLFWCGIAQGVEATPIAKSIGGQPVGSQTEAPWSVLISIGNQFQCSGSIIDATHVLTAAHCTAGGQNPPSSYRIYAGKNTLASAQDKSEAQQREVSAQRIMPQYRADISENDIAELTVNEPFDFSDPAVGPITIVSVNSAPPVGGATRLVGWGHFAPNSNDLHERSLMQWRVPQRKCWSGVASLLCTHSEAGSPCGGDSGAGVVTATEPPLLIGVASYTVSSVGVTCAPNLLSGNADLSTPELQAWLAGDPHPPQAPRSRDLPVLSRVDSSEALCNPPTWSGSPNLQTLFLDANTEALLQSGGSPRYRLEEGGSGREIRSVSVATNAGGTTEAGPSPTLELPVLPRAMARPKAKRSSRSLVHFGTASRPGRRWRVKLTSRSRCEGRE